MKLHFQNERQVKIATLIWNAEDQSAVNSILDTFGHDAQVVYHMIVATMLDDVNEVALAKSVLHNISKNE